MANAPAFHCVPNEPRTFYDRMPARDTLGVELYPAAVQADAFGYGKTRVMAVISDVSVDDCGNVARVSTANAYDKYGRVVANYVYDPTMPADSLKMLAVETEYDLGGKVTKTRKYPYGLSTGGANRKIEERYTYDRLGRVDSVFSKNGSGNETLLAHYTYYPTGEVKTVSMGNSLSLTYTYHISGAVKSAKYTYSPNVIPAPEPESAPLYSETLYYEDCGDDECTPQYNGNISYMAHRLLHDNRNFVQIRNVAYTYDQLNRLTKTDDFDQDYFDESFAYDAQGRIAAQRRYNWMDSSNGGEYTYYDSTNRLKSVAENMGGTGNYRIMSANDNFVYDSEGNLVEDKSKGMTVVYDWRGKPVEFARNTDSGDSLKLVMKYDGAGRRVSKTSMRKVAGEWDTLKVTHYTGIGTEVREEFADSASETKVVVNMPQGLGRYGVELANYSDSTNTAEWYLKNHLGSTMAVYRTTGTTAGSPMLQHAYDYRSYGEKINLTVSTDKVTENFTGKELDDETLLSNHGARLLDPMLGMWISVDSKRFFSSPYLYMGNGYNPVRFADLNGQAPGDPFGSAEAAAQDFAKLYNGVSIATSTEYGTIIYRKGNSFSYVTPSLGTSRTVDLDECVLDVAENAELQLITSAHTHGSYSGFRSLEPSSLDFSSEFIPTDINLYPYYKENMNEPAYVAVPNGTLIEYRSDGSQRVVPAGGLAADLQSRWGDVDKQYHADLGLLE